MKNKVTIINDDLLNVNIPKCRLLLTDIPYGEVNRESRGLRLLDKGDADIVTFSTIDFLEHIYDSFDICVIFCGISQFAEIFEYFRNKSDSKLGTVRPLVWTKTNPSPMNGEYVYLNACEFAVWFKKRCTGKLNNKCVKNYISAPTGSSKYHPTEKNHKLLEEIILQNSKEGDLIVDTCMGSGSTGIVSLQNNRRFFGIELNKHYYDIATERINKVINKE